MAIDEPARAITRRGPPAHQSYGTVPRRDQLPITRLGSARLFFTHASNGLTFTDLDRQHLYRIKYQPADQTPIDEEETAA